MQPQIQTPILFAVPSAPIALPPLQWLQQQRDEWTSTRDRIAAEMMRTIEDHAAASAKLEAIERLLSLYE
jgi:hypothetical protein